MEPIDGTRRTMLKGCLALCSADVLGGCASYGAPEVAPEVAPEAAQPAGATPQGASSGATADATADPPAATAGATADDGAGGSNPAEQVPGALARLDDIPVGGALILADAGVVLVRPDRGTVRGLSATCTHAGCSVGSVQDDVVVCPCHGSRFALADGSVVKGPAGRPLDSVAVRVEAGQVLKD